MAFAGMWARGQGITSWVDSPCGCINNYGYGYVRGAYAYLTGPYNGGYRPQIGGVSNVPDSVWGDLFRLADNPPPAGRQKNDDNDHNFIHQFNQTSQP